MRKNTREQKFRHREKQGITIQQVEGRKNKRMFKDGTQWVRKKMATQGGHTDSERE